MRNSTAQVARKDGDVWRWALPPFVPHACRVSIRDCAWLHILAARQRFGSSAVERSPTCSSIRARRPTVPLVAKGAKMSSRNRHLV